jgi:acetyl-CoA C-acetyltransferase
MTEIVITAAKRTPVGSFLGAFAATPAHELGRIAIEAALAQAGVTGEEVSEVILGQVLTAAQGQNPARQASMARRAQGSPAWGVNQVCGSGLRAVALAGAGDRDRRREDRRRRRPGEHVDEPTPSAAPGTKMGDVSLVDTMIKDGLTDVFNGYHMGITAENLAEQYQVTRASRTNSRSARRTSPRRARLGPFKDEIAPVTIKGRKGDT